MEEQKTQWTKNIFVFGTVGFCLAVTARMGFDQTLTTKMSEIVADGLISLAMFVSVSYLAAQTVDYSGVLSKVGNRLGGRSVPVAQPVQMQTIDPMDAQDTLEAKG